MNKLLGCILSLLLFSNCADGHRRLVVFGDSISYGYYADFPYPQLIANQFNILLENHSVTSTTLDSNEQIGAIRAASFSPGDRILFSPGINDAGIHKSDSTYLTTYESLLKETLDKFEGSGAEAFVGEPLHVMNPQLDSDSQLYANILLHILASNNYHHIHFVRSRELFVPSTDVMHDPVHPNTSGHFQLYKIFYAEMQSSGILI